jgi:hypothetical protein
MSPRVVEWRDVRIGPRDAVHGCPRHRGIMERISRANAGAAGGSGRAGIRTLERVAPLTVFKTVAFVRSATLPPGM